VRRGSLEVAEVHDNVIGSWRSSIVVRYAGRGSNRDAGVKANTIGDGEVGSVFAGIA
jgi:hypothetical protein